MKLLTLLWGHGAHPPQTLFRCNNPPTAYGYTPLRYEEVRSITTCTRADISYWTPLILHQRKYFRTSLVLLHYCACGATRADKWGGQTSVCFLYYFFVYFAFSYFDVGGSRAISTQAGEEVFIFDEKCGLGSVWDHAGTTSIDS